MRTIVLEHTTSGDFLNAYLPNLPEGGVFVRTTDLFRVGQMVQLLAVFPDIPEGIQLAGRVCWKRPQTRWRSALQPGIGVGFLPEDKNKIEFMLAYASGQMTTMRRPDKRVPVDMKVEVLDGSRRIQGRIKDISRGGISMISGGIFVPGDYIEFDMYLNEQEPPERCAGRVVWSNSVASSVVNNIGIGIKFEFKTSFRQRRILHFLNQLNGRLKDGKYVAGKETIRV